ncbi:MAG: gas vesicle protein GvpJ [Actinomycetota bacterium]
MKRADGIVAVPPPGRTTLVDVLDRILEAGAAVTADLTLAVADVDLVQVNLRALVAAIETARAPLRDERASGATASGHVSRSAEVTGGVAGDRSSSSVTGARGPGGAAAAALRVGRTGAAGPPGIPQADHTPPSPALRLDTDPERVERGLAQLVMTVVGLLKDLMERQAARRVEAGTLGDDEVERLGTTFVRLEERFAEILERLQMGEEDLALDLGPLGRLR